MASIREDCTAQGWNVYHLTGKAHYEAVKSQVDESPHYRLVPFVYKDMDTVLGAADVVVARGSATFIQELSGLGKACIVIPARHLGDQLKNAAMYEQAGAAIVLDDDTIRTKPMVLFDKLSALLHDEDARMRLAEKLHSFARPDAARDVADMIDHTFQEGRKV